MQRNPDTDSRLVAWRSEVRNAVERRLGSLSASSLGESLEPYAGDARVGTAPLIVLYAGRCLANGRPSPLDSATAVEFARLHLRTHATLRRDGDGQTERRLLAGDLYRSLATRTLIECDASHRRRIGAVKVLSDAIVEALEDVSSTRSGATDDRTEATFAGAAIRLSTVLFGLTDRQRRTLEAAADRLRPPDRTLPSGRLGSVVDHGGDGRCYD